MKVTVKVEVTIPISLRERFGLNPGTEVEFVASEGALQVKPHKRNSKSTSASERWLSKAAGSAKRGMSTDAIMALTRSEV
jgi:AbrB family looped-hinge helix DNA binding protein